MAIDPHQPGIIAQATVEQIIEQLFDRISTLQRPLFQCLRMHVGVAYPQHGPGVELQGVDCGIELGLAVMQVAQAAGNIVRRHARGFDFLDPIGEGAIGPAADYQFKRRVLPTKAERRFRLIGFGALALQCIVRLLALERARAGPIDADQIALDLAEIGQRTHRDPITSAGHRSLHSRPGRESRGGQIGLASESDCLATCRPDPLFR